MKVELKIPTLEEKEVLIEICNQVERKYLSERMPYPYTDEDAQWWINMIAENDGKTGVWRFICADGKIVGNISVELKADVYHKDAEIGYLILDEYRSKGIVTEAAKQICKLAFETLDIIRITGLYYGPNAASGRVLEKAGFEYEGTRVNGVVKGDQVYDLIMTGLLKEKFCGNE